jgi:hypothetical protein
MVGQFTDRRGHTRNFAYRIRNTLPVDKHNPDEVIEINPARNDATDNLIVQMKVPDIAIVRHINSGIFESVPEETSMGIFADGRD